MKPINIFIRKPIGKSEIKRRIDLALKMLSKMDSPICSVSEFDAGRALLGGVESRKPWINNTTTSCVAEFTELDDIMHFNKAFYIGNKKKIDNYFANQKKDNKISKTEIEFYTQAEIALFMLNDNWWSGCYGHENKYSIEEIVSILLKAKV